MGGPNGTLITRNGALRALRGPGRSRGWHEYDLGYWMHKGYVQQACLPLDEGRSIRRSSGTTARLQLNFTQLRERPEGFGEREVQNLVLL